MARAYPRRPGQAGVGLEKPRPAGDGRAEEGLGNKDFLGRAPLHHHHHRGHTLPPHPAPH